MCQAVAANRFGLAVIARWGTVWWIDSIHQTVPDGAPEEMVPD
jgi:hypothetical protein